MAKSCGSGKIRRKSYERKAHSRKSYKKGSTKVRGSYVNRTHVPSTCVKDTGKPGKTPKSQRVLPKPGEKLHLSKFGYATHKAPAERHKALREASRSENPLMVLKRLNLLANYQADPRAKAVMREDVDYMSMEYKKYKRSQGRVSSKKSSKVRKGSKKSSRKGSKKSSRKGSRKGSKKGSRK